MQNTLLPKTIVLAVATLLSTACSNTNQSSATIIDEPKEVETTTVAEAEQVTQTEQNITVNQLNNQLTDEVVIGLKLMYEEEKLAYDTYITLYDKWGIRAFANIAQTEARHQQAVKDLLDTYGIKVDANLPVGKFADEHLQQAYDELIAKGTQSEEAALKVGAYVEELDIQDLNRLLELESPADVTQTYEWLNMGSRNHLRGFVRNMTNRGVAYTPQLLDVAAYQAIINSDNERGGGQGRGMGKGNS